MYAVESLKTALWSCEWLFWVSTASCSSLLWQASLASEIIHVSPSTNDLRMVGGTPPSIRSLYENSSGFVHWGMITILEAEHMRSAARTRHSSKQKKPQSPEAQILQLRELQVGRLGRSWNHWSNWHWYQFPWQVLKIIVVLGEKMLRLYQWQERAPFWPRQMLYISWCRAPVPMGKLGPPRV